MNHPSTHPRPLNARRINCRGWGAILYAVRRSVIAQGPFRAITGVWGGVPRLDEDECRTHMNRT